ncbi:hypothetical protein EVG20_g506 [Dentipellis fragilis]|uniref:Carbohydrate kinase PfkB domain-containing protein n=1 Tax=Dentipellis fragilis TaxID=205917 RepID=A0A4Y9ZFB9_9AGAM|nr:hypothetical protein EVG20_g506 [Dentipellis fragilis]
MSPRQLVTLGMFIIDEFVYSDEDGRPTGRTLPPQAGHSFGASLYLLLTSSIVPRSALLPPHAVGMIVDRGADFPAEIESQLVAYGKDMWLFRDHSGQTTRALNSYKGDHRGFEYLTPRIRLTPLDLKDTAFANPRSLHFICSPSRASVIVSEIKTIDGWSPTTIYEPIPYAHRPATSPNAEEALSLLSIPLPTTKPKIEEACARFLEIGVGPGRDGWVIVRSGALGAYVASANRKGEWISAFWEDEQKVVDVTGAGNGFLGGLAAGLALTEGDVFAAAFYGTVSASFIIEQQGLPHISQSLNATEPVEHWNNDYPTHRLQELKRRHAKYT